MSARTRPAPRPRAPRALPVLVASLLAIASLLAVAPAVAGAPGGSGARADVRAALRARTTPTAATRVMKRLDRAFREARSGRGDLLEALLDVPAVPEGRERLLAGPSPGALSAACANALDWTGDPEAAAELLARLFEIEREDGRLLIDAFAPRETDGSLSLPGAR